MDQMLVQGDGGQGREQDMGGGAGVGKAGVGPWRVPAGLAPT